MYKFTELLQNDKASWTLGRFYTNKNEAVSIKCAEIPSPYLVSPYLDFGGVPVRKFEIPKVRLKGIDLRNSKELEIISSRSLTKFEEECLSGEYKFSDERPKLELYLPTKKVRVFGTGAFERYEIVNPFNFTEFTELDTIKEAAFQGYTGKSLVDDTGKAVLDFSNCSKLTEIGKDAFHSLFGASFDGKVGVLDFSGLTTKINIHSKAFGKVFKSLRIILPDGITLAENILEAILEGSIVLESLEIKYKGKMMRFTGTTEEVNLRPIKNKLNYSWKVLNYLEKVQRNLKEYSSINVKLASELVKKVREAQPDEEGQFPAYNYSEAPIGYAYKVAYNEKTKRFEASVYGFSGHTMTYVEIPATIKDTDIPVTSVIHNAFAYTGERISSITAGTNWRQSNLRVIGGDAFSGHSCPSIRLDFFPKLERVGSDAFESSHRYTLAIGETLTHIGANAFKGVTGAHPIRANSIKLPATVRYVGFEAFHTPYSRTQPVAIDISQLNNTCCIMKEAFKGTNLEEEAKQNKLQYMFTYPDSEALSVLTEGYNSLKYKEQQIKRDDEYRSLKEVRELAEISNKLRHLETLFESNKNAREVANLIF